MSLTSWNSPDPALSAQRVKLLETLRAYGRVAVAYSGGIDSTVVAQAAQDAVGNTAVAVTAVSESLASGELEEAQELAQRIGIRHRIIYTAEFTNANYLHNQPDRCYFCKSELYGRLSGMLDELGADVIVSGANMDDLGDHRPGMQAAAENQRAPSAPRVWTGQGRCPGTGPGVGFANLGQARNAMSFQPHCLW